MGGRAATARRKKGRAGQGGTASALGDRCPRWKGAGNQNVWLAREGGRHATRRLRGGGGSGGVAPS